MNRILSLLVLLFTLLSSESAAQRNWHRLPGKGLVNQAAVSSRYEDVYFTDSMNGHATTLLGHIFRTTDAGRNWTIVVDRLIYRPQFRSIEFLDDKATGICAGLQPGNTMRTTDSGKTWTELGAAINDSVIQGQQAMCGLAHFGNTFYGAGAWFTNLAHFYKSTDKGLSWKTTYLDSSLISCAVDVQFTSQDTGLVTGSYSPGLGPSRPTTCAVVKTTDGGGSWRRVFYDTSIHGRIWKIQALSPTLLVASIEPYFADSQEVAMIRSTDGGEHWSVIRTGFTPTSLNGSGHTTQGVGFADSLHGWLGGYYRGMYETADGGSNWRFVDTGSIFNRYFVLDSEHVYAGGHEIFFWGTGLPGSQALNASGLVTPPHILEPVRPNPSKGKITIRFELLNETQVRLEVANTNGHSCWEIYNGYLKQGRYSFDWDGHDAPAGNYIVWLGTHEIPITTKFSIIR